MYDENYEEYMRNVLCYGYIPDYRSLYYMMPQDLYNKNSFYDENLDDNEMMEEDLEKYYPEIYKTLYPKIKMKCMDNTKPISKELIDGMVEELYSKIENDDSININVNIGNTSKINNVNTDRNIRTSLSRNDQIQDPKEYKTEKRETRHKNYLLCDLIRILLLREFSKKPQKHNNKPPKRPYFRPPYSRYDYQRPPTMPHGQYDPMFNNYEY